LDIVVLTSFNEGTPLSLIEAQLCGKPVVASNVGGVKDTLINGESGFLIDDHSLQKFSDAIVLLAHDKELRNKMGENGKHFATAEFSKETEVAQMRNIYLSINTKNSSPNYA
jgi:glycosyltransferase involved in cell wall biosynthesis